MRFIVLGAGAIGSVFGGFLADGGHDVYLLGRESHMEAIEKQGLLIDGIWGTRRVSGLKCMTRLGELADSGPAPFDAALLTVKSYDTSRVISEFAGCRPELPPVVSLQNGLGNVEKICALAGRDKTIGGRVIFGVELMAPGHARVTVSADRTKIGCMRQGPWSGFAESLALALTGAGIPTDAVDDINRYIWGKVLYNCCLNGLATILNVHYGSLLSCEGTRRMMRQIVSEIFDVARAGKVRLGWETPESYTRLLFEELIPRTFEHHPSMLQDIQAGRQTEIDALNGAVVEMGRGCGLELPVNRTVARLVKAREQVLLPRTEGTGDDGK